LSSRQPGSPTAFESLVDDYDAARPRYPAALFDALPTLSGARVLELGAGTGIATRELVARGADVVATDLGPRMLGRLRVHLPRTPAVVARAEALPFRDADGHGFDAVVGAQMWHWVEVAAAAAEVARVLVPGGWLAVWWNEVFADDQHWWHDQQDRLEAANPGYTRDYRRRDHGAELKATGRFADVTHAGGEWVRELDLATYERWLRSKSYVAALGPGLDEFLAAERASLAKAFPSGVVREPFRYSIWIARTPKR
jgi:SAM-dependent methyltransferase